MLDQNGELLPGTSGLTDSDKEISAVEESSLLESSDDELESGQRSPIRKRSPTRKRRVEVNHQQENPSKRTRYDNSTEALAKKISKSEESIRKLKAHAEKKTCPKSLRYNVRANIVPDQDFKNDINSIRKEAEQKFIGALTRFHYRKTERLQSKLRKTEQKKNLTMAKGKKTNNDKLIKNRPKPAKGTKPHEQCEKVISLANTLIDNINKLNEMRKTCEKDMNKEVNQYPCCFSDYREKGRETQKRKTSNKKHNDRKKKKRRDIINKSENTNRKYIKNLSDCKMTTGQINLLSKGLKFIPTPFIEDERVKRQLLQDFKQFARRMRLRYIFHGQDKPIHPFYVKSDWEPPEQSSAALENFLEGVKTELAEIKLSKPKQNLPRNERKAIKELKTNYDINIKKADKGSTTVILNKKDKIQEGQIQLNDKQNYLPLEGPMVKETFHKAQNLINELHSNNHIDDMTRKWLSQTPNPPRIPVFYTLTKIHKPTPVGRPIISGCDGPTERISSFIDHILQPIAQSQESYLKDTKDFINFIERTTVPPSVTIVSMDVTSLYTNIPQEEGIETVCKAYDKFYKKDTPIPTHILREMIRLVLQENSFQFNGSDYLQTHGTAMGTKMAVAFANIFMSAVENNIIKTSKTKPLVWKRYIDDVFSLWDAKREDINLFILEANRHHPTIKFTADISQKEINFLDTTVFKGERFNKESILDIRTHFKATETFQYTHFSSCHAPGVAKGFIKGEALRLLRTNSSKPLFEENISNFKSRLRERGYPSDLVEKILSEVKFTERKSALQEKQKVRKNILPFVTQYNPSVPNLKKIIMSKWHLIQQQPLLREIFKEPPIICYKRGRSLKDILVKAKL